MCDANDTPFHKKKIPFLLIWMDWFLFWRILCHLPTSLGSLTHVTLMHDNDWSFETDMLKLILCAWDSELFIDCSIPSVNICVPTSVDHYVTTNSAEAGRIAQLALLTVGLARVTEVSISFVSQICYRSSVVGSERTGPRHSEPVSKQVSGKNQQTDIRHFVLSLICGLK